MAEEAEAEESYYDEEDDGDGDGDLSGEQDDGDASEPATAQNDAEMTTQASTVVDAQGAAGTVEEAKDDEDEYDSDYDEEGRYIWGAEGEDWEFYYQEDKEAYERGESTVPETLNPDALPRPGNISI